MLLDAEAQEWKALATCPSEERTIDVWWMPNRTGELMLVLAYLLTRNDEWREAKIRVLAVTREGERGEISDRMKQMLRDVRIPAEVHAIVGAASDPDVIARESGSSSLVFLQLGFRPDHFVDGFGHDLTKLLPRLPVAVLTLAAEDFDLKADPDEGEASERAAAMDAYDDAKRGRDSAVERYDKSATELEKKRAEIEASRSTKDDGAEAEIEAKLKQLSSAMEKARASVAEAEIAFEAASTKLDLMGLSGKTQQERGNK